MSSAETVDNRINQVSINLKIIANIKEYDKLMAIDNQIEIDHASYVQFLKRWWNGRNRKDTVLFLREFIFNDTFKIIDDTLENELRNKQEPLHFFRESNHNILQKFLLELKNAITGIHNLKITYNADITIKSQLDVIIEEMEFRIEKIKEALKINLTQPIPLRNGKIRTEATLDK